MKKKSFIRPKIFMFVLTLSLISMYSKDVILQASEQGNGDLTAAKVSDKSCASKTKKEEDPYFDILNVIKNFFERRFDADKTQSLTSISKDYKVVLAEGNTLDYYGLKSGLEDRSRKMSLLAVENLQITELEVEGSLATLKVEFFLRVKIQDGKIRQTKHVGEVFLRKEGSWKITAIIDLHRLNIYDKNFLNSCFKNKSNERSNY